MEELPEGCEKWCSGLYVSFLCERLESRELVIGMGERERREIS